MGQNLSFGQQTMFLVQNGTWSVGIDDAFHQDVHSTPRVRYAPPHVQPHGSSICQGTDILRIFLQSGIFSNMAESFNHQNSPIPSSKARDMAYSVLGSLAQTTAIRFLLLKVFRWRAVLGKFRIGSITLDF